MNSFIIRFILMIGNTLILLKNWSTTRENVLIETSPINADTTNEIAVKGGCWDRPINCEVTQIMCKRHSDGVIEQFCDLFCFKKLNNKRENAKKSSKNQKIDFLITKIQYHYGWLISRALIVQFEVRFAVFVLVLKKCVNFFLKKCLFLELFESGWNKNSLCTLRYGPRTRLITHVIWKYSCKTYLRRTTVSIITSKKLFEMSCWGET